MIIIKNDCMVDNSYISVFLVNSLHVFKNSYYIHGCVADMLWPIIKKIKSIKTGSLVNCIV